MELFNNIMNKLCDFKYIVLSGLVLLLFKNNQHQIKDNKNIIIYILIGYLVYSIFLNKNSTITGGETKPSMNLYYADWCGHCKNFKPEWKNFEENSQFKDKINIKSIDCTDNTQVVKENKVEGFPTVRFHPVENKKKYIEYTGGRDFNNLEEFVKKQLG